jgi:sensor histidine kinase YesM
VPPELENLRIPSLILQPIVENAIKHGVSENRNGGEVRLSAALIGANGRAVLRLTVADTGTGRSNGRYERAGGVGLKNVRERLDSYYGKGGRLTIAGDALGGTVAEIVLPINSAKARS